MPTINIYVSETDYLRLAETAKNGGCKITEVIQTAIKDLLDSQEAK